MHKHVQFFKNHIGTILAGKTFPDGHVLHLIFISLVSRVLVWLSALLVRPFAAQSALLCFCDLFVLLELVPHCVINSSIKSIAGLEDLVLISGIVLLAIRCGRLKGSRR